MKVVAMMLSGLTRTAAVAVGWVAILVARLVSDSPETSSPPAGTWFPSSNGESGTASPHS